MKISVMPDPAPDIELVTPEPALVQDDWRDKLVAACTIDPWFADESNIAKLVCEEGLWYNADGQVIVPCGDFRKQIISDFHDSPYAGHVGINKTNRLVSRYYSWPGMDKDINDYVRTCHLCQKNKARQHKPSGVLNPVELPYRPWECVSMDFITQLPMTLKGHDAIFVVVDKLTKMVHILPTTTNCTAVKVAELYRDHVFKHHGIPAKIISDRDSRFIGTFSAELEKLLGIRHAASTAYHPQSDGQTERVNRVLEDMLRNYVAPSQDNWDEYLSLAQFAINNSVHKSTGSSPFMLNFGFNPRLPLSIVGTSKSPVAAEFTQAMQRRIFEARTCHRVATQRQKLYADRNRVDVQFKPDDWVLLSSKNLRFKAGTPKLLPRWVGPFQVVKAIGRQSYELNLPSNWHNIHDVFHVSSLEAYRSDGSYQPPPPAELLEGEDELEVEAILAHRPVPPTGQGNRKKKTYEYLLRWRGQSSDFDTWEPEVHLKHASILLRAYWDSVKAKEVEHPMADEHRVALAMLGPASGTALSPKLPASALRRYRRSRLSRAAVP